MKKTSGLLIIVISISIIFSCKDGAGSENNLFSKAEIDTTLNIKVIQDGNLSIFKVDKYSTTIIKIPNISSYLYTQRPVKSLEQIANDSDYSLIANGSFFDILYDDSTANTGIHYKHAGYLKINNKIYEDIKKDDRQLSRLFAYNSKKNIVHFFSLNELDKTRDYDLVIQTGPQIIKDNLVDTSSINLSINGNRKARRTTFATVNGNEFYIIITLDIVTLAELGKMLISTGIFKKELDVIDFDGGPSTRIYIRNHPELSWSSNVPWPLLICIK